MSEHSHNHDGNEGWWIARPQNANKVFYGLLVLCAGVVIFDLLYHNLVHAKHGYFAFETMIGFHAFYGLVAFMFVVLTGKQLRNYLMRDENYYEPDHLDEYQAEPQAEDNH